MKKRVNIVLIMMKQRAEIGSGFLSRTREKKGREGRDGYQPTCPTCL